uniref:Metalloendopeptidase n=1 Tax=Macrostomum lignano TaxID=282301 RepID=A0A1I8JQL1_9PLAT
VRLAGYIRAGTGRAPRIPQRPPVAPSCSYCSSDAAPASLTQPRAPLHQTCTQETLRSATKLPSVDVHGDIALDEDDVRILRRNGVLDGKEPPASAKKATTAEELQAHLGQFADIDSDLFDKRDDTATSRQAAARHRDRSRRRGRRRRNATRRQAAGSVQAGHAAVGERCIRFVEKENSHSSYIEFTALDCGCCSYVGRKGGVQSVSIGKNCDKLGIVMHELGHVIGFWHEHTRPDRDKYIEIIEENILESQKYNFKVLTSMDVDSLGEPTFATPSPNLDAMRPVQCCPRPNIGQRSYISAVTSRQVHKLYGCRKCGPGLAAA